MRRIVALAIIAVLPLAAATPALARHEIEAAPIPTGQPKQTIMVGAFEGAEIVAGGPTGPGLAAMLAQALVRDGRFVVLERGAGAQDASGRGPAGAGVVVLGTVTKFIPNAGGGGINLGNSGGGFLGMLGSTAGASATVAKVEINLRLVDSASGEVIYSGSSSGSASSKGIGASIYTHAGMQIGQNAFLNTPLGKASEQAIGDAVRKIRLSMDKQPWTAYVIEADGSNVFINAGSSRNMRAGMLLYIYRSGKPLIDPITHVVLETPSDPVGTLTLQAVHEEVSSGALTSGNVPEPGDIVKLH